MASPLASCGWSVRPRSALQQTCACQNGLVTSRREFLTAASLLLAGAACRRTGGSSVETFPSSFVSPGNQTVELDLVIAAEPGHIAASTIDGFHAATKVTVSVRSLGAGDELLLRLAAGGLGQVDIALVDAATLAYMVEAGQAEPLARTLVPNRRLLDPPFDDSPFDSGLRHSVPVWYDLIGVAVSRRAAIASDTWESFFTLAERHPGRVVVPDRADEVIGAILTSLGHAWDSDSGGDLTDARGRLAELRPALHVLGTRVAPSTPSAHLPPLAQLVRGEPYRAPQPGTRFFAPGEGTAIDVRSYCIPIYAPHPVAAHAWLDHWLDPSTEVAAVDELHAPAPLVAAGAPLTSMLAHNQAIAPPPSVLAASIQPDISADGRQMRDQIWTELHL
jgi:spermidine/putrescine transport system substrate-binding protein